MRRQQTAAIGDGPMPRKILRPPETWARLGRRKTSFEENIRFHAASDPFITGTRIERLRAVRLGPRCVGYLEHEVDRVIDALAEVGGNFESKAKNRKAARADRVSLTDSKTRSRR
jgi:hypothetical protein